MAVKPEDEDFPDDFDVAYAQFASNMSRPESSAEPEAGEQQQAVLNEREYNAFTEFLDHVLVDPLAARKDEVHWLDLSMYNGRQPTGLYVPMERVAKTKATKELGSNPKRAKVEGHSQQPEMVLPTQKMTGLNPNPLLSAANAPTPEPTDEELPQARNRTGQNIKDILSSGTASLQPNNLAAHQPQTRTSQVPHNLPRAPIVYTPAPMVPQHLSQQFAHPQVQPGGMSRGLQPNPMMSLQVAASSDFYKGFVEPPKLPEEKGVDNLIQAHMAAQLSRSIMSTTTPEISEVISTAIPASASGLSPNSPANSRSSEEGSNITRRRREYLSVDQVRQNHINSEKRRRDHIKQLFSEMCSLVPAINSGGSAGSSAGPPKSVVMQTVYRFIVDIAEQNRQLRRVLVRSGIRTDQIPAYKLSPPLPNADEDAETPIY